MSENIGRVVFVKVWTRCLTDEELARLAREMLNHE